jgi:hypothetical protein
MGGHNGIPASRNQIQSGIQQLLFLIENIKGCAHTYGQLFLRALICDLSGFHLPVRSCDTALSRAGRIPGLSHLGSNLPLERLCLQPRAIPLQPRHSNLAGDLPSGIKRDRGLSDSSDAGIAKILIEVFLKTCGSSD